MSGRRRFAAAALIAMLGGCAAGSGVRAPAMGAAGQAATPSPAGQAAGPVAVADRSRIAPARPDSLAAGAPAPDSARGLA
ncbi:MAG: hypothetical protein ABIS67_00630, partial [Candidatus Eisenbacteria bacterium]